ncbi:DUF1320 domain-containing protein [Pendulispora brunnea]|uniref:DUF1320 domain-containing protein n=1 Tax=Pendulispora brunnea TaxID=2905690 RepID=A0ABZ2KLY2_9BACT
MAPSAFYITPSDLRLALTPDTFLEIFDDDRDRVVTDEDPAVEQVLERAQGDVESYLLRIYGTLPPPAAGVPRLLKSAALDYAIAYSFERHPEYVRSFGEEKRAERWLRAERRMERIAQAVQILADHAPEPKPRILLPHIYDNARRVVTDDPDGSSNGGDFG